MKIKLRGDEVRKYVKFKVKIYRGKPIVLGWTLDRGMQTSVWIKFSYEKLPNICFKCGKFDHETRSCPHGSVEGSVQAYKPKYGLGCVLITLQWID